MIVGSKDRSPAVRRSPSGTQCRSPDLNWEPQHFQCCALPIELPRQTERVMRFELTTFSLARRRSTTELHPRNRKTEVDPVGFEPTIFSLQKRRLPTRPRAPAPPTVNSGADERTRTSTPLRAIDPKSTASTGSATSAGRMLPHSTSDPKHVRQAQTGYPRFCTTRTRRRRHLSQTTLGLAEICPENPNGPQGFRCGEIANPKARNPLTLLPVARSPSHGHLCTCWWALTPPFHPLPCGQPRAGMLSVAVVVAVRLPKPRPHLLFREATFRPCGPEEVGKFLCRPRADSDGVQPVLNLDL